MVVICAQGSHDKKKSVVSRKSLVMLFVFLKISLLRFKLKMAVDRLRQKSKVMINQSFINSANGQQTVYQKNFLVALTNWKLVLEEEKKKRRK